MFFQTKSVLAMSCIAIYQRLVRFAMHHKTVKYDTLMRHNDYLMMSWHGTFFLESKKP